MTTLWKLEAVHDRYEGSFCRLFRREEAAAEAAVSLARNGWWLDVARVDWPPLGSDGIDRAVSGIWPIADEDDLLVLVSGPPLLEQDLREAIARYEQEQEAAGRSLLALVDGGGARHREGAKGGRRG